MDDLIKKAYDPDWFRLHGHRLVDSLADYLETCQNNPAMPVIPYYRPDEALSLWESDLAQTPTEDIDGFYKALIEQSIHTHHPKYLGHQVSPVFPLAALSDFLGSFLDCGVGVYEMGSASVALERLIIKTLAERLGMGADADGFLTSGGTLGNLTALVAARHCQAGYDLWNCGYAQGAQMAFMVSEEAHYSATKAVKIMGLGEQGIIKLPVNQAFQIDVCALSRRYENALASGKKVVALVANACSTAVGAYDPLVSLADFCKTNNLWFHVDAAHGGAAIFSDKYRHLLDGVAQADSVIIDFHKMMMTPALATAVIFKRAANSYMTFEQSASYLWDNPQEHEWFNLGRRAFECTKRMMSVKIYSLLRTFGPRLFAQTVTRLYDLGAFFGKMIDNAPDFELAVKPQANIVCFRYLQDNLTDSQLDQLNADVRQKIIEQGAYHIVQTRLRQKLFLRSAIMNPYTQESDLTNLLDHVRTVASSLK
jgi:L-2,4-diaminobutyrate decarboxylase